MHSHCSHSLREVRIHKVDVRVIAHLQTYTLNTAASSLNQGIALCYLLIAKPWTGGCTGYIPFSFGKRMSCAGFQYTSWISRAGELDIALSKVE